MSNALVFQTREQVFISADSAVSVTIDGVIYRDVGTTAQKLFHVDNSIIFCSGELDYCYKLMKAYRFQKDRNIDSLRSLIYQSYINEAIDIVIAEYVGEQTRVTQLSPYNDFNPVAVTDLPVGALSVISAGIRTKEAHKISYKYLMQGNTLESIYKDTYNQISFEGIGGMLYVYRINKDGVQLHLTHQIVEPNHMRIFNLEVLKDFFINRRSTVLLVSESTEKFLWELTLHSKTKMVF